MIKFDFACALFCLCFKTFALFQDNKYIMLRDVMIYIQSIV